MNQKGVDKMSDDKESLINIGLVPKELITNLFGPATKSIGEGLGGITNFVMGPLRKLNVVSEKSYQDFVEKVNAKTDDIPIENRDASKLGLVLKAMEDSRFQLDDESMREYFANLIAGLVDDRKNLASTPRFSTILSDLTSSDAELLTVINQHEQSIPLVDIRIQIPLQGNGMNLANNIVLTKAEPLDPGASLNILESYGLIEVSNHELLSKKNLKIYSEFEYSDDFNQLKEDALDHFKDDPFFQGNSKEVIIKRKALKLTNLGVAFCSMVFSPEEE